MGEIFRRCGENGTVITIKNSVGGLAKSEKIRGKAEKPLIFQRKNGTFLTSENDYVRCSPTEFSVNGHGTAKERSRAGRAFMNNKLFFEEDVPMFDQNHVFLGIAPIGWCNDDMPELGGENTFQQIVSEMALAGFTGCEIGNKYPTDPAELKRALDLRGMRIASRWYSSFILTRPYEEEEKDFIANLDFLAAVGANRINVSEQSYSIQGKLDTAVLTGENKHVMDDAEWDRFCDGLNRLGKVAADRGFKLCFHHHMGTVVQTSAETDRMMSNTDPRYVFLCYDTGHFTFASEDPLAMLKKYVDRVGHVHLKDMRLPVVEDARKNNWSFLQAVRNGAFTVPGDGDVDFDPVFKLLADAGYQGWLLVEAEQDPAKANPLEYAIKARKFIAEHTGL